MPSGKKIFRALLSLVSYLPYLWRYQLEKEEVLSQSDLRRAVEDAKASTKAKTAFLSNMSHELRTPINGITGMSWLLLESDLSEEQRDYALRIKNSAETMLRLINDVMDYSRLETKKLEIKNETFQLANAVQSAVDCLEFSAVKRGLRLATHVHPTLATDFLGDPGRIQQILANLIDNAIKFTESGEITVRVSPSTNSSTLRFEVNDTGTGVPPEVRKKIFQAFEQGDSSSTRQAGGSGLGLSISKKLVELMGGTIGFTPLANGGSSFWFTLPLGLAPQPEAKTLPFRRGAPATENSLRVLVVEDNETNRMVLGKMLEHLGHNWQAAENGREALYTLEQDNKFDLILVDGHMPLLDGKEFTRVLRRNANASLAAKAVIAVSADAIAGSRESYLEAGMNDYLSKPVTLTGLAQVIEKNRAQKKPA